MLDRLGLPFLRLLPPEPAHRAALFALRWGMAGAYSGTAGSALQQTIWGQSFANPLGVAAGFDKNAEAALPLWRLGFGFVEVGTVTPRPQAGNPKPRLFRLPADRAVINRMGFNNDGHDRVAQRVEMLGIRGGSRPGPLGVNIGANKDSTDRIEDYVEGVRRFAGTADYLTVNISSPNTPGLRGLQDPDLFRELLRAVTAALPSVDSPPLLVKLAPDLSDEALADIAGIAAAARIDGIIVANTSTGLREQLQSADRDQQGGLSGQPLFRLATDRLRCLYQATEAYRSENPNFFLIGAGGICGPDDAYEKILAGATLLQIYTAFSYRGPAIIRTILDGLADRLRADGIANIGDAVGQGH